MNTKGQKRASPDTLPGQTKKSCYGGDADSLERRREAIHQGSLAQ